MSLVFMDVKRVKRRGVRRSRRMRRRIKKGWR